MNRELFTSILLFTLSTVGSLIFYSHIVSSDLSQTEFLSQIASGDQNYNLMHDGLCVGNAQKSLETSTDLTELKSSGKFRIKYLGNTAEQTFNFNATFNSLGQMGGSVLKISMGEMFVSLGSTEIDPMSVKLKTNAFGKLIDQSWQIPGPVEIKKNSDNSYRINYKLFSAFAARYQSFLEQPFIKSVNVTVNEIKPGENPCSINSDSALDLSNVMADIYNMISKFQSSIVNSQIN